jgi:hypothetical protein
MEIKAILNKPYSSKEKADFVVLYNHTKGYEIKETSDDLEAWGLTADEQEEQALENKKAQIREVRNSYLEATDKYMLVDFPISDEERESYKAYRQYLRDYTAQENWWENEPMTYEEWLVAHHPIDNSLESDTIE